MEEMNKMDAVVDVVDTVSDVANSTSIDVKSIGVGIGVGGALAAAGIFVWRKFISPKWTEHRRKAKLQKAKRVNGDNDVPPDIEKEYPIK